MDDPVEIRPVRGLSEAQLDAIAGLADRVVAHDGGRMKLEFSTLRARDPGSAQDVLAWAGERLVGFTGLYDFSGPVEIAGMVDPAWRRRGIGGRLLAAALALRAPDAPPSLLVVPRGSGGGRALAAAHGARLDHSEHALRLSGEPVDGPEDPELTMRAAQRRDVPALLALLTDGFGYAPTDVTERLAEPDARTIVFERHGRPVACLRAQLRDGQAGVYGFAVDARLRGRGIGRDALRRTCRELRARGAREVGLEVEVDNDRALGLYRSLGFMPVVTEDYWELPR